MEIHPLGSNPIYWFRRSHLALAPNRGADQDGELTHLYGVGSDGRPIGSSASDVAFNRALQPFDLLQETGQWSAVFGNKRQDGHSYTVLTDYTAYQRLYVVDLVVGREAFWAVCHDFDTAGALASRYSQGDIRWDVVRPTLTSDHNFLTGTWARETWHSSIREVAPNHFARLYQDKVEFVARPFSADPEKRDYGELLQAGIARAVGLIKGAVESARGPIVLYLSGGRDSRACLALAAAAGVLGSIRISSENPEKFSRGASRETVSRDLAISVHLEKRFGLVRHTGVARVAEPTSYAESLQLFQAKSSGLSYEFAPQKAHVRLLQPATEIRGAGGELIRSAYSGYSALSWWSRLIVGTPSAVDADIRSFFGVVTRAHLLPKETLEESRETFREALHLSDGAGLAEQLSLHYAQHRNRAHFGALDAISAENRHLLYPLILPEFHFAAHLLPFERRARGDVVYDIIEQTTPELNRLPFDNAPGWSEDLYRARGSDALDSTVTDFALSSPERRRMTEFFERTARVSRVEFDALFHDGRQHSESLFRSSLDVLRASFPDALPDRFTSGVSDLLSQGRLNAHQSATRVASLMALAGETPLPSARHVPIEPSSVAETSMIALGGFPLEQKGRGGEFGAMEISLIVRLVGSEVVVDVSRIGLPLAVVEYAFYLRSGEEILERVWYSEETRRTIPVPLGNHEDLSVLAFARIKGHTDFCVRLEREVGHER